MVLLTLLLTGPAAAGAGFDLSEYRTYAAQEAGPFLASTASAGSTFCELEDLAYPMHSQIDQQDRYNDLWCFRPLASAADKARVIKAVDNAEGRLTPDLCWDVAPSVGEPYEIHGVLEPTQWRALINEALKDTPMELEFSFTPVPLVHRQPITAPWLTRRSQIRQVGYLGEGEDREISDPFLHYVRGQVTRSGAQLYLETHSHTFNATDTVYVRAVAFAHEFCRSSGGEFGDQAGLAAETDQAIPPIDVVAYNALAALGRRAFAPVMPDMRTAVALNGARWATLFTERLAEWFVMPELKFHPVRLRGWMQPYAYRR